MAHSIDKATFEGLEKGWVTSAGVLMPGPWLPEVVQWARQHPKADLGVRLDINADWSSYRWRPVSSARMGSSLTDAGGYLSPSQMYVARHATTAEVEGEERAQIDLARRFGMRFTHLDNHMRALLISPALFETYWKMGQESGIPIVLSKQFVKTHGTPTHECGGVEIGAYPSIWITVGFIEFSPRQIWAGCPSGASDAFCPHSIVVEGNISPISGKTSNTRILSCHN